MSRAKKMAEIQQKIYRISRELAGAPGVETQDGRFNLSRFLAIYGSLGVCGTASWLLGPGTTYPQVIHNKGYR
tara:strand:+ start:113 stop:331 length:219 start_codon:yes stop_codon:yes gene_type:complete